MTKCKSMLEAFILGGDFHSRTALNMFDHIQTVRNPGVWTCRCLPRFRTSHL